jgi:hypothetical protein
MAKKFILNRKNVNVVIHSWYYIDGEYISFPYTEIDGTKYDNVDITIHDTLCTCCGIAVECQRINITGQEPIDCELVSFNETSDGQLIINICQDWG